MSCLSSIGIEHYISPLALQTDRLTDRIKNWLTDKVNYIVGINQKRISKLHNTYGDITATYYNQIE